MIIRPTSLALMLAMVVVASGARSAPGQEKNASSPDANAASSPSPASAEMGQMMALAMPGENHKLLASQVGSWTYIVKFWLIPDGPPSESTGVSTCKPVMDGRYFITDSAGKFQMPGTDGQMQSIDFKGMSLVGYDNGNKKFIAEWIDNMGTGVVSLEGTYDPSNKTFTYRGVVDSAPGVKMKVRETIKILDQDHHLLEWYEDHGGKEVKSMEISYTRQS